MKWIHSFTALLKYVHIYSAKQKYTYEASLKNSSLIKVEIFYHAFLLHNLNDLRLPSIHGFGICVGERLSATMKRRIIFKGQRSALKLNFLNTLKKFSTDLHWFGLISERALRNMKRQNDWQNFLPIKPKPLCGFAKSHKNEKHRNEEDDQLDRLSSLMNNRGIQDKLLSLRWMTITSELTHTKTKLFSLRPTSVVFVKITLLLDCALVFWIVL